MAHPRRVVPGETYLITRRCYQRSFRLRPSAQTNGIFLYCLAFAAARTRVEIHAVCVMSNHHHLIVTDPLGVLPDFLRELHRLTAKAINASQGQWENLWAAEPCNVVRLVTDQDVEQKIAYVVANPVAGGLVRQPEEWPGVLLWGERSMTAERPKQYFAAEGACPAKLTLRVVRPRTFDERRPTDASWHARIRELVVDKVAAAHRAVRLAGQAFLGRASVLATSFARRARTLEARFGVIPTFAARAPAVREALRRAERAFRVNYRDALERWWGSARNATFPAGTWAMVVVHGAAMAGSDASLVRAPRPAMS